MKRVFSVLIGIIVLSTMVFSQPPVDEPPPPPGPPDAEDFEKMEERMQTFRMWKLTDELDLSEEQATSFLPKFNKFQDNVRKVRDENEEIVKKIRGLIAAEETGGKLNSYIDQIENNDMKVIKLHTEFRKEADKILTDIQMAKFVVFQHEFPKMMRKSIQHQRGPMGSKMHSGKLMRNDQRQYGMRCNDNNYHNRLFPAREYCQYYRPGNM